MSERASTDERTGIARECLPRGRAGGVAPRRPRIPRSRRARTSPPRAEPSGLRRVGKHREAKRSLGVQAPADVASPSGFVICQKLRARFFEISVYGYLV